MRGLLVAVIVGAFLSYYRLIHQPPELQCLPAKSHCQTSTDCCGTALCLRLSGAAYGYCIPGLICMGPGLACNDDYECCGVCTSNKTCGEPTLHIKSLIS